MAIVVTAQTTTMPNGFIHTGDAENDVFAPTDQADTFFGGGGHDTVSYAASNLGVRLDLEYPFFSIAGDGVLSHNDEFQEIDEVIGSRYDDALHGEGTRTAFSLRQYDFEPQPGQTISGMAGNDFIGGGGAEDDVLFGGTGDDNIASYYGGRDELYGGDGHDRLFVQDDGDFSLFGESGDDWLFVNKSESATLFGGEGNDDLVLAGLHRRSDEVELEAYGGAGADTLSFGRFASGRGYGGADDDMLVAEEGSSATLLGGEGNDIFVVRDEAEVLAFGHEGSDRFVINSALGGTFFGGEGNDFYVLETETISSVVQEDIPFSRGGGIDTIVSSVDITLPNNFEILRLEGELARGVGNHGDNVLVGGGMNDVLSGRGGLDRLLGRHGDDTLIGNSGADSLIGGVGADTFIYTSIADSRAGAGNRDFINGFDHYRDVIDLTAIDANTYNGAATNDAWTWIGQAAFDGTWGGSAGQLRYMSLGQHNAVIIEGDHNGDGRADFQIFVNGTDFMSVADFLL